MNPLKSVQHRALLAALLTMGGALLLILAYWQGVSNGSLPSPTQPLVASPVGIASNPPPAKVLAAVSAPKPAAPVPSLSSKSSPPDPPELVPPPRPVNPPGIRDAGVAPALTNLVSPALSHGPATPATLSTNRIPEDERLARHWLDNTNQRPTIRVRYQPADILRLSTKLGRGLLVAGSGTTTRREVFLQPNPGAAPVFSPFTTSVAQAYSTYSLALHLSPMFEPVTMPLLAYFPDGRFDLAFIPDRALATEIFAKAAQALRSGPGALADASHAVLEGQLRLSEDHPIFELSGP